ncbi:unnamed protein product, partial [Polarella glacialis]
DPGEADCQNSEVDAPPAPWDSFKLLCFTWNLGDAKPLEEELSHWLPLSGGEFDLVVVGVQECGYAGSDITRTPYAGVSPDIKRTPKKRKSLQGSCAVKANMIASAAEEFYEILARSPSRSDLSPTPRSREVTEKAFSFHWDDILAERLGDGFVRVQQAVLMSMRLLVFARAQHCDGSQRWRGGPVVHSVQQTYSATGLLAGTVGNKGGLVVSLGFGPTSLCFVSCHLAAHMKFVNKRDSDCQEILAETWPVCHSRLDAVSQFDHCFWLGDLNYRIDMNATPCTATTTPTDRACHSATTTAAATATATATTRPTRPTTATAAATAATTATTTTTTTNHNTFSEKEQFFAITALATDGRFRELMAHDQLTCQRALGKAFAGFQEGCPDFPPTFKVERRPGVQHIQQRAPSYCDRVLWKSMPPLKDHVLQHYLGSVPEVSSSDHKPVVAHFELRSSAELAALLLQADGGLDPARFPVVRVSELRGHGLGGASGRKVPSPYVVLLVAPLQLNSEEHVSAVKKRTRNPVWRGQDLPVWRPAATTQAELSHCTLLLVVYDRSRLGSDVRMGCVALRFPAAECSSGTSLRCSFHEPIVDRNQTEGRGTLRGVLEVDWSPAALES